MSSGSDISHIQPPMYVTVAPELQQPVPPQRCNAESPNESDVSVTGVATRAMSRKKRDEAGVISR